MKMAIQLRKIYQSLNAEMLRDEVRDLLKKHGINVIEVESQTYALPSGATQSRITLALKAQTKQDKDPRECGSVHIMTAPGNEVKMLLDVDEDPILREKISVFQSDLEFILGSYEVKW